MRQRVAVSLPAPPEVTQLVAVLDETVLVPRPAWSGFEDKVHDLRYHVELSEGALANLRAAMGHLRGGGDPAADIYLRLAGGSGGGGV